MEKIRIGSMLDLSNIDWIGHTVFMIFCSGCNCRCPFCSNSSLIPMNSGREIGLEIIKERILANRDFIDAIGFTGGEPSLQQTPIIQLCKWAREEGLKIFFNTNGSNSEVIKQLLKKDIIDYVALDVKAPLKYESYGLLVGLKNGIEQIVNNIYKVISFCKEVGLKLETRTTIVPTLMDDEESIREIAKSVNGCNLYVLQEFFPFEGVLDERLRNVKPPDRLLLTKLAKSALNEGLKEVYIRSRQSGFERVLL